MGLELTMFIRNAIAVVFGEIRCYAKSHRMNLRICFILILGYMYM